MILERSKEVDLHVDVDSCWVYGSGPIAPRSHRGTAPEGSGALVPTRPKLHPRENLERGEAYTRGQESQTPNDDVSTKR
ncbi:unnamed protein product [Linum trigynum]|uniref:Uncharacterized protein n=1 Tax=Linum trigynum TaxID=586398 RepID=A0AAV2GXG1_9ROSI